MISLSQSIRYGLPGFALAFSALPLYLPTPSLYADQLGLKPWIGRPCADVDTAH